MLCENTRKLENVLFFAQIVSHGHTAVAREARMFQLLNIGGLKFSSQKRPQGGLL